MDECVNQDKTGKLGVEMPQLFFFVTLVYNPIQIHQNLNFQTVPKMNFEIWGKFVKIYQKNKQFYQEQSIWAQGTLKKQYQ